MHDGHVGTLFFFPIMELEYVTATLSFPFEKNRSSKQQPCWNP